MNPNQENSRLDFVEIVKYMYEYVLIFNKDTYVHVYIIINAALFTLSTVSICIVCSSKKNDLSDHKYHKNTSMNNKTELRILFGKTDGNM